MSRGGCRPHFTPDLIYFDDGMLKCVFRLPGWAGAELRPMPAPPPPLSKAARHVTLPLSLPHVPTSTYFTCLGLSCRCDGHLLDDCKTSVRKTTFSARSLTVCSSKYYDLDTTTRTALGAGHTVAWPGRSSILSNAPSLATPPTQNISLFFQSARHASHSPPSARDGRYIYGQRARWSSSDGQQRWWCDRGRQS